MRWTIVLVASFAVGCYGPAYRDCEVSCASGAGCPSGLTCDETQHRCRAEGQTGACTATGDDGGRDDDANTSCWQGVTPSNFAPCDSNFPAALPNPSFINGEVFDTDSGRLQASNMPAPGGLYSFGGHDVWLVHATSFALPSGSTLNTVGETPLLVVADGDIQIDGTINVLPVVSATGCGMLDGHTSTISGAGGAGGGHAASGGAGGANSDAIAGAGAGPTVGNAMLIPLTVGCSGGGGGGGGASTHGGRVGLGGGAIELAAQMRLSVGGRVLAVGGGAGGGQASALGTTGCAGNVACAGGGGGGGAGGAILLEAPMISAPTGAMICAGGGGGGEGGDSAMVGSPKDGTDGSCMGGLGGASIRAGGDGGAGSISGAGSFGKPATNDGVAPPNGGGGGGGGPGRIRIHATTPAISGTVAPAAAQ